MTGSSILHFDTLTAVDWGGGLTTTPLVSHEIGATDMTSGITSFEPGAALKVHSHNCSEVVCVIEGEATAEVNGELHPMKLFDATYVPAGITHRYINTGKALMRIFWTYPSGKVSRTFPDTGITIDDLTPPK